MTVTWNDALRAKLLAGAMDGLEVFVKRVVENGNNLIESGPKTGAKYPSLPNRSSAPGEAPAYQFGDLVRSGHTRVNPDEYSAEAVWDAEEATKMEYGTERIEPRPYARPALLNEAPNLARDVNAGIVRRVG